MMPEDQMMACGTVIEWDDPVPSKVFDWRDNALLPEAEWGAAINTALLVGRRAELDVEGVPPRRARLHRAVGALYRPTMIGGPISGTLDMDDRSEQVVEFSAGWEQTLKAHLLEQQAELSATVPMARSIATSAVGDKVLSISYMALRRR